MTVPTPSRDAVSHDLDACLKAAEKAIYDLGLAITAAQDLLRAKPPEQAERIAR